VTIEIRMLGPDDAPVLERVAPEVFDNLVDARWSAEFLADSRHHLAVALDADTVVGIASAVHYLHPDKPPELWINEVSVTTTHRAAGVGRRLLHAIFKRGRKLGCREAWVATEQTNIAARRLYVTAGGYQSPAAVVMYAFRLDDADS